jgi:hypothetical protein
MCRSSSQIWLLTHSAPLADVLAVSGAAVASFLVRETIQGEESLASGLKNLQDLPREKEDRTIRVPHLS